MKGIVAVLLAGCTALGGGLLAHGSAGATARGPAGAGRMAGTRSLASVRLAFARQVLAEAPLPRGARRSTSLPPLLRRGLPRPGFVGLVDVHRGYDVPGTLAAVRAKLAAHLPGGANLASTGTFSAPGGTALTMAFDLPVSGPHEYFAAIAYGLSAPAGAHDVALRVDAQTVWLPTPPARERIPRDARVTLTGYAHLSLFDRPRGPASARLGRAAAARLLALLDRLPPAPQPSCMEDAVLYRLRIVAGSRRYVVSGRQCEAAVEITLDGTGLEPRGDERCTLQHLVASLAPRGAVATRRWAARCRPQP